MMLNCWYATTVPWCKLGRRALLCNHVQSTKSRAACARYLGMFNKGATCWPMLKWLQAAFWCAHEWCRPQTHYAFSPSFSCPAVNLWVPQAYGQFHVWFDIDVPSAVLLRTWFSPTVDGFFLQKWWLQPMSSTYEDCNHITDHNLIWAFHLTAGT